MRIFDRIAPIGKLVEYKKQALNNERVKAIKQLEKKMPSADFKALTSQIKAMAEQDAQRTSGMFLDFAA